MKTRTWQTFLASCMLLTVCAWPLHALARPATDRVGTIHVQGNTKTETELIVAASGLEPGMRIDAEGLQRARQRILNQRVFTEVEVKPVHRGSVVDVDIQVKERWTLLPIPFVSSSDGVTRGGVFLLESNLFGQLKTFAAGVTFSNHGTSLFGFFRDPSLFGSRWVTRMSALHEALRQQRHDGPDVVYAFQETRDDLAAALGYKLTPALTLSGGGFYLHVNPSEADGYAPPDKPDDVMGASVDLVLRAANYHSYFDEGVVLRSQHRQGLTGRQPTQSDVQLLLTTRTFDDHSASLFMQFLSATGDPAVDAYRLGGRVGTRGFTPLGLWAEHAATAAVEYQIPIAHFSPGTWTINGFCDAGAVVWQSDRWSYVTPGLSTRFYLKNVAFPAVGVDVGYATRDARVVTSASVGMSF